MAASEIIEIHCPHHPPPEPIPFQPFYLENIQVIRSLSGGFTPCRHHRPSSGPEHSHKLIQSGDDDYLMNDTWRKPITGTRCPTLFDVAQTRLDIPRPFITQSRLDIHVLINALITQSHRHGWTYQGPLLPIIDHGGGGGSNWSLPGTPSQASGTIYAMNTNNSFHTANNADIYCEISVGVISYCYTANWPSGCRPYGRIRISFSVKVTKRFIILCLIQFTYFTPLMNIILIVCAYGWTPRMLQQAVTH